MDRPTTTPVDHPGSYILEELEARGWSQSDLAYILGMSLQQLSPLLSGERRITPETALALGDAFDVPADFFANLQKAYDLQQAKPADPGVRARATWQSVYPVREMIARKWIEDTDPALLDLQMLRFFERNRVEDVPFIGPNRDLFRYAARKTDYDSTTPVQYAWLYRTRKIAETIQAPLYSASALKAALKEIREHMVDPEDIERIPHILLKCGVRFVVVESLPKAKIDGVCLWVDGQPVIGMTTRFDRMDNFCFVLRHEIEHVLQKHGFDEQWSPIDVIEGDPLAAQQNQSEEEKQANTAAAHFLIPAGMIDSFIARKSPFISERDVNVFAQMVEINPAIVVGQIQYKTKKYGWLRRYQTRIREYLASWDYVDGWDRVAAVNL